MVVTPDPSLLKKAMPVERFDKKLKRVIKEMEKALDATYDPVGVGLAAPQVGIPKRIFLTRPKEGGPMHVFINPEIVSSSDKEEIPILPNSSKVELMKKVSKNKPGDKKKLLEGCLSVPNIWGNVARKNTVELSWQDETGKKFTKTFKGFPAIIVQHELDHLDGILFTKHVLAQGEQLYRSYKNDKGEDEFEEIEV